MESWIAASDQLPDDELQVLVWGHHRVGDGRGIVPDTARLLLGYYLDGEWFEDWTRRPLEVSHWMEAPGEPED